MNVAIITARSGSIRLPDKHLAMVGGRLLIEYPIKAATDARLIDAVYLATDSTEYAALAEAYGCEWIRLPAEIVTAQGTQAQALVYAVDDIRRSDIETVTCLLGNTAMVTGRDIDAALQQLVAHPDATSVMSVWRAEDDHPLRAMRLNDGGYLQSYAPAGQAANSQGYPDVYYQDQGIWCCRVACFDTMDGPVPWTWAGARPLPLVREWWVGRDVDVQFDLELQRYWAFRQEMNDASN